MIGDFEDYLMCPECDSELIVHEKEVDCGLFVCKCENCGCRFRVQECTQYRIDDVILHGKEAE